MSQIKNAVLLEKIAAVLKHLREQKGLSQGTVYNDTGIHIGRIEMADANLSVSTLAALCKYFKVKLSDFFRLAEGV